MLHKFFSDPGIQRHDPLALPDMAVIDSIIDGKQVFHWLHWDENAPTPQHILHGPYLNAQDAINSARDSSGLKYWILQFKGGKLIRHGPFDDEEAQIQASMVFPVEQIFLATTDSWGELKIYDPSPWTYQMYLGDNGHESQTV